MFSWKPHNKIRKFIAPSSSQHGECPNRTRQGARLTAVPRSQRRLTCRVNGDGSISELRNGIQVNEKPSYEKCNTCGTLGPCPCTRSDVAPRPSVNTWHFRVPSAFGLEAHSLPRPPYGWEAPQWLYAGFLPSYRGLFASLRSPWLGACLHAPHFGTVHFASHADAGVGSPLQRGARAFLS